MKFNTYLIIAAVSLGLVSCNINKAPVFEDSRSFAAMDVTSLTVQENVDSIVIPVTIASVKPLKIELKYAAVDGSAKSGVNFNFRNPSATLSFDGESRTEEIIVDIVNLAGVYTGDLEFTVTLEDADGLELGEHSSCSVKLVDLDHPLAEILGDYTVDAYDKSNVHSTWAAAIEIDPDDDTKVRVKGLMTGLGAMSGEVLRDDNNNIEGLRLSFGQIIPYSTTYDAILLGYRSTTGEYAREGRIVFARTAEGWEFMGDDWSYGIAAVSKSTGSIAGWFKAFKPSIKIIKK